MDDPRNSIETCNNSLIGGNPFQDEKKDVHMDEDRPSISSVRQIASIRISDMSMAGMEGLFNPIDDDDDINYDDIVNISLSLPNSGTLYNPPDDITEKRGSQTRGIAKPKSRIVLERDISSQDIKLGRGKPLQRHKGNIWFRDLVSEHFTTYDKMEKKQQTKFSKDIVQKIKGEGRWFWKPHPKQKGYWVEVSETAAREKVAYTFRTMRKKGLHDDPSSQ